jgi:hypothetical protein
MQVVPLHHGAGQRAVQDGGDVHRAEDPQRRGGGGLYKLNAVDPVSLKPPEFNPETAPRFKLETAWVQP